MKAILDALIVLAVVLPVFIGQAFLIAWTFGPIRRPAPDEQENQAQ